MAVTPKGIVTPDASSPYNLITDLNTLASTTDAAIATQKGTASQRTAALAGAPDGTLWQDTNGIKMIWRKDGSVWVPAVWRWAGTTAQMNGFTQAPNGFEWHNTSTGFRMMRDGTTWKVGYAKNDIIASGTLSSSLAVTQIGSTGVYGTSPQWRLPHKLDSANEYIEIRATGVGSGYGIFTQNGEGTVDGGTTLVPSRYMQVGNNATQTVTVRWTVYRK